MEKAIVYYRMSCDQQDDSIPKQRAEIQRLVDQYQYEIVAEYQDEGLSGSKETHKRKNYLQMLHEIQTGNVHGAKVLLLWKTSRFSRENPLEAAQFYLVLAKSGTLIHDTVLGKQDLNTQNGRMLVMFQSEQNHAYSIEISDNSSGGRRNLAQQGWWVAGSVPYGYDKVYISKDGGEPMQGRRNDRTVRKPRGWRCELAVFEEEARWVRYIFDAYANQKLSLRKIAQHLNEHGVLTPSGSPDRGWTKDNLRDMFRNKAYCGYLSIGHHRRPRQKEAFHRIGEMVIKSEHVPAIVSEELWQKAFDVLMARSKNPHLHTRCGENAWKGVMYCGHCGYALDRKTRVATGNQRGFTVGERYAYFTCSMSLKQPGKQRCHQWRVQEADLEAVLPERLVTAIDERLLRLCEQEQKLKPTKPERELLQRKLDLARELVDTATDRWLKAAPDLMDAAERRVRAYKEEADRLEDELRLLDLKNSDLEQAKTEWELEKSEVFEIDELVCRTVTGGKGGMFPERMSRVRIKAERKRLSAFLQDLHFRMFVYWKPMVSDPKRVRHERRKTTYVVDRAKIEARIVPPKKNGSTESGPAGGAEQ